jgi:hypothetical protein
MQLTIALAVAAVSPASLAGFYQSQTMEVGGGIELKADGHFRYELDYGAVSEGAEGTWTTDGGKVLLTTSPTPTGPTFDLVKDAPAPRCSLSLKVDWGRFGWSSAPDVLVAYQAKPKELHMLQADERGVFHLGNCAVTTLIPMVPIYDVPGQPLKLSPAKGHRLTLRFRPNDLGHAAFRGEPLNIDGNSLLLERYGAQIRFQRVRP